MKSLDQMLRGLVAPILVAGMGVLPNVGCSPEVIYKDKIVYVQADSSVDGTSGVDAGSTDSGNYDVSSNDTSETDIGKDTSSAPDVSQDTYSPVPNLSASPVGISGLFYDSNKNTVSLDLAIAVSATDLADNENLELRVTSPIGDQIITLGDKDKVYSVALALPVSPVMNLEVMADPNNKVDETSEIDNNYCIDIAGKFCQDNLEIGGDIDLLAKQMKLSKYTNNETTFKFDYVLPLANVGTRRAYFSTVKINFLQREVYSCSGSDSDYKELLTEPVITHTPVVVMPGSEIEVSGTYVGKKNIPLNCFWQFSEVELHTTVSSNPSTFDSDLKNNNDYTEIHMTMDGKYTIEHFDFD